MSQDPRESVFHSLRARIWLAVVVLALLNAGVASLLYLAASFITESPFLAFTASLLGISALTGVFGFWLGTDILKPIEALSFFAKSLERSPAASNLRTTGAVETDEILASLQRNSRQILNLISMMDDVTSGRTEKALKPIASADRLTTSFQRLVGKVTDSVNAKNKLETTRAAIERLRSDLLGVRHGSINIDVRTDQLATREVAESVALLLDRLRQLLRHIRATSDSSRDLTATAEGATRTATQAILAGDSDSKHSRTALEDCRNAITDISSSIDTAFESLGTASGTYETLLREAFERQAMLGKTRSKVTQSVAALRKINETVSSVGRSARTAGELARRSNVVAVNSALGSESTAEDSLVVKEIEHIASRSDRLGQELSALSESASRDLLMLEKTLSTINAEIFEALSGNGERPRQLLSNQAADFHSHLIELTHEPLRAVEEALDRLSSGPPEDALRTVAAGEKAIHKLATLLSELDRSTTDLGAPKAKPKSEPGVSATTHIEPSRTSAESKQPPIA
ncbi:MAG: hypothetical protein H0V76_03745 [Blastocatellia bacterium]|nr:hypothetical protein [Blastocatellia bacterium]